MVLKGLHFLLTYQCTQECDHCFVWSSPNHLQAMTISQIRELLSEAKKLGTIDMIWFEGGEPFLYYPIMIQGIREARKLDFKVGALSNAYWATSLEDAVEWLRPLAESSVASLGLSSDEFHGADLMAERVKNAVLAASKLDLQAGIMATKAVPAKLAELCGSASEIMYRGRAAKKLLKGAPRSSWTKFDKCPHENLVAPERVHVDPLGYIHACQGLSIGNCWKKPLSEIVQSYDAEAHPIIKWLAKGGPVALVQQFGLPHKRSYADACHLCYEARLALKSKYSELLAPGLMYGEGLE